MFKVCFYDKNGKIKSKIEKGYLNPFSFMNDNSKIMQTDETNEVYFVDECFKAWRLDEDLEEQIENITKEKLINAYGNNWKKAAIKIFGHKRSFEKFAFYFYDELNKEITEDDPQIDWMLEKEVLFINHSAGYLTPIADIISAKFRIKTILEELEGLRTNNIIKEEKIVF